MTRCKVCHLLDRLEPWRPIVALERHELRDPAVFVWLVADQHHFHAALLNAWQKVGVKFSRVQSNAHGSYPNDQISLSFGRFIESDSPFRRHAKVFLGHFDTLQCFEGMFGRPPA